MAARALYMSVIMIPYFIFVLVLCHFMMVLTVCVAPGFLEWPEKVIRKIGDTWLDYIVKHKYKSGDGQLQIRGYKFTKRWPNCYKYQMSLIPITIIFMSATVFWEVFWIEVTYDCDTATSGLDCFDNTVDSDGNSVDNARLNCSQYLELPKDNQTDVICFRFVYDLTLALGAAGGILTLGTVVTAAYIVFITAVLGCGCCGKVLFGLSHLTFLPPAIIFVVAIVYSASLETLLYILTGVFIVLVLTCNCAWINTEPPPPDDNSEDLTPPCCNFQCCKTQQKEHTLIQIGDTTAHPVRYEVI